MVKRDAMQVLEEEDLLMGQVGRLLGDGPREDEPEQESTRKTKITPHERGRKARQMSVTFPEPEWKDAVQEMAERWRVRPADVMVFAFSYMMDAIEAGELRRPAGEQKYYHRSGEALELPWKP